VCRGIIMQYPWHTRSAKPFSQPQNAVALFMDDSCTRNKLCEVGDYMSSMLVPSRLYGVSSNTREGGQVWTHGMYLTPAASTVEMISSGSCKTQSVRNKRYRRDENTYNTGNLDGVDSRDIAVESLPSGNPARARVCQSDEALEDLAGAFLDGVVMAREFEKLFAVGTSFTAEARAWKDDAADHAGAQRAVL